MSELWTSEEWVRIAQTTLPVFIKGAEDCIMRNRVLPAMLKSKGRIKTRVSGQGMSWRIKFTRAPMKTHRGMTPVMASGTNRYVDAKLTYEGYQVDDFVTKMERLMNMGTQQIIDVYGEQVENLKNDLMDQFAEEIYLDGAAAGNEGHMSGIETMMGINGTVTITSGAQRTANVADVVAYPQGTYAGVSTKLGALGGSWKTQSGKNNTWPMGSGTPEYDATSPTIVNYGYAWDGTNHTWEKNGLLAIRYGIRAMKRNKSPGGIKPVPLVLMGSGMYGDLLNLISPNNERINIENTGLRKLGFDDSFYYDGAELTSEFGIPDAVAYGFDVNAMQLISLQSDLFVADGPTWNQTARGWITIVDCLGNFKFMSPRNFAKWANIKDF